MISKCLTLKTLNCYNNFYAKPQNIFYTQLIFIMKENKEFYVIPAISIVELKQESVICASGEVTSTMEGTFLEETIQ